MVMMTRLVWYYLSILVFEAYPPFRNIIEGSLFDLYFCWDAVSTWDTSES